VRRERILFFSYPECTSYDDDDTSVCCIEWFSIFIFFVNENSNFENQTFARFFYVDIFNDDDDDGLLSSSFLFLYKRRRVNDSKFKFKGLLRFIFIVVYFQ
jgi:hypothetical protein